MESSKSANPEFSAFSTVSPLTSQTSQIILNFLNLFKTDSDDSYLFKTYSTVVNEIGEETIIIFFSSARVAIFAIES